MKSVVLKIGLTTVLSVGLGTAALAQYDTRIFQVDSGGRVPRRPGETASRPGEWVVFTFTVTGFAPGLVVYDVNINIDMVHSWVEDLVIVLRAPFGTEILLFDGDQLPGAPPRFDNFDNTYFTDEATTRIQDGSAPYNGDYRPLQALSAFKGRNPNGIWRLFVFDMHYGDYGYLYRQGDPTFENGVPGAPRWRGPLEDGERLTEWGEYAFQGGTWLEITVPEPASLMALAPALGWLLLRRRRR
ncbi:MAG: proprotein convertase P-domain-containing protein [Fimbriimonadales bacterium]|nr:proprotein convertase P-domain-containing protein [Fimbriimonadales bacterium]